MLGKNADVSGFNNELENLEKYQAHFKAHVHLAEGHNKHNYLR